MKTYISKVKSLISDIKETEKVCHEAIQLVQTPAQIKAERVIVTACLTKSAVEGSPMEKLVASGALLAKANNLPLTTNALFCATQALKVRRLGLVKGLAETAFWSVSMGCANIVARDIDSK